MNIINLGTYPPKQCGIATFSNDLRNSLLLQGNDVEIMSVSDDSYEYNYPEEVVFNLKQNQKQDYKKAATYINTSPHIKLVIIQHEYGIYGGFDGEYLLDMVRHLHKPYILITHTVLPHPSRRQKQILNLLCCQAAGIVCMTQHSASLLQNLYEAPSDLVSIISHGVPEFKRQDQHVLKEKYGLNDNYLISTFGLIGPGKGLELGIRAIAQLVEQHPSIRYMILGQTHPMLRKHEGEKYRQMLIDLVSNLGIEDHVIFVNKFLSDDELGEYLYMSDVYLSPYPNKDQAVSGTMAFALGCGRAIVSTPYAYATEMLSSGRGLLSKEPDPDELAKLVELTITNPDLKKELQQKSFDLGKSWTWPNIGKQYTCFMNKILNENYIQEESAVHYAKL
ncbi:MAG: glycosyltransferase family 4 protein [Bacillota bacterium]|nr:glycosyltransferase family 4 protein [Bacillota bacterium]